jgi:predicted RNA-binding Zn-ribbon protein involved in translation (DUF1610 family)
MNINMDTVEKRCLDPIEEFFDEGVVTKTKSGVFIYKNNGCDVLAIAHLDSVNYEKHFVTMEWNGLNIAFTTSVDDRIGAYTILDLLPSLGIKTDILLTEGEEIGQSTAWHFEPPSGKKYNWMFSFDREGRDVVMYEYENIPSLDLLEEYDFKPSWGSFSDICYLNHLECIGFNFGTGYYDSHMHTAHFAQEHLLEQVEKFVKFFNDLQDTEMIYDLNDPIFKGKGNYYSSYGYWDDFYVGDNKFGTKGSSRKSGIYRYNVECPECHKHTMNSTPEYDYCSLCSYYKDKKLSTSASYSAGKVRTPGKSRLSGKEYDWCDFCKGAVEDINLTYVEGAGYICAPCLITYFDRCDWCRGFFEKTSGGTILKGESVCYDCYNDALDWYERNTLKEEQFEEDGETTLHMDEDYCPKCKTRLELKFRDKVWIYVCPNCGLKQIERRKKPQRDASDYVGKYHRCPTCKIKLKHDGGLTGNEWVCPNCKAVWIIS